MDEETLTLLADLISRVEKLEAFEINQRDINMLVTDNIVVQERKLEQLADAKRLYDMGKSNALIRDFMNGSTGHQGLGVGGHR